MPTDSALGAQYMYVIYTQYRTGMLPKITHSGRVVMESDEPVCLSMEQ